MKKTPKTRWRDFPKATTVQINEMSSQKHHRMDAEYYIAKNCLTEILDELRHDTKPSIEEFMDGVDLILDQPNVIRALVATNPKRK